MYYIYVLYSHKDRNLYTGYTGDLKTRMKRHQEAKVDAMKYRQPFELIYYEAYKDKRDATKREYFLKRGRGRELLRDLLQYSVPK